jgi:poly-gamma-glutamate synthesis protein (capsule biosynthesis protein)
MTGTTKPRFRLIANYLSVFVVSVFAGCGSRPPVPEPPPLSQVDSARLVFVGDVMSHSPQVAAARTPAGYDYTGVFRYFRPVFEGADIAVANLETTLRTTPPYTGYPSFAAPVELAFALREAGIDIVTTANNHICDKGGAGIRSTLALLDSAGLRHTGAFLDSTDRRARNPLRFTAGGMRFALLTYTYGTNGIPVPKGLMVNIIDTAVIARDLSFAREQKPDCIIVSYHWGEEYRTLPTRAQRDLAAWTRARGADLIIGGHPHVVEPVEAHYNADSTEVVGATYYSLGNFVSNQRRRHTDGGIAADITVTRARISAPAADITVTRAAEPAADSMAFGTPPPLRFDLGWRPGWVHTFWRDGARRYEVLPAPALDTLPADARSAAQTFLADTRRLLSTSDTLVTEYQ